MSMLPDALQCGHEGHLSEIALSTYADGQLHALSAATHAHLDGCESCQARLADAVLEHHIAEDLVAAMHDRALVPSKTPWAWILGAAMFLFGMRGAEALDVLGHRDALKQLGRASMLVMRSLLDPSTWWVSAASVPVAALLVLALARWVTPRERV